MLQKNPTLTGLKHCVILVLMITSQELFSKGNTGENWREKVANGYC